MTQILQSLKKGKLLLDNVFHENSLSLFGVGGFEPPTLPMYLGHALPLSYTPLFPYGSVPKFE